jgi:hypothetical protein
MRVGVAAGSAMPLVPYGKVDDADGLAWQAGSQGGAARRQRRG